MFLPHRELTAKIIGCAMKVHNKMGSGYREKIYSRCLAIELERAGLNYKREVDCPIQYDGIIVGRRIVDYIVESIVSLELKAIKELTDKELNEGLNYLESHNMETGLLINFGSESLEFKRLFNKKYCMTNSPANPVNPSNPGPNPWL
jgi:GxxExxY protein